MQSLVKVNRLLYSSGLQGKWVMNQIQTTKAIFCKCACNLHTFKGQNFSKTKQLFTRYFSGFGGNSSRLSTASRHFVSNWKVIQSVKPKFRSLVCLHSINQRRFSLCSRLLQTRYSSSAGGQDVSSIILYICSGVVFMIGVAYAAVPLYRIFCQATGLGGDPTIGHKIDQVATMKPIRERKIRVTFNADHHSSMQWNFKPSQSEITVVPGETALAFYTAKNPTDKPIVGIATYNVVPFQAGLYFNKIQCFCFEEQWLNPNEEVDMPVFFYIDPDYDDDPVLAKADDIILSYTFFKAEEGQTIPLPGFMKANSVVNLGQNEATA